MLSPKPIAHCARLKTSSLVTVWSWYFTFCYSMVLWYFGHKQEIKYWPTKQCTVQMDARVLLQVPPAILSLCQTHPLSSLNLSPRTICFSDSWIWSFRCLYWFEACPRIQTSSEVSLWRSRYMSSGLSYFIHFLLQFL